MVPDLKRRSFLNVCRETMALVASISVLSGCAAASPYGVYGQGHVFWGESIELKRDFTFIYGSVNDDFSEECTVEGTWTADKDRPHVVVLRVSSVTQGDYSESCDDKPLHKTWIIRSGRLISASKEPYRVKLERL